MNRIDDKRNQPSSGRRGVTATVMVTVLGVALASPVLAAGGFGGTPGQLLRYGSSARSLAMGDAFAGLADDVSAVYWNPAGLQQLRTAEFSGMHAELLGDADYQFFAVGVPTSSLGNFALSGVLLRMGGFERTSLFEDLEEEFSDTETAFVLSYSRGLGPFAVGANVKTVNQSIAGLSGSGLGADLGLFYRPSHRWSLGFGLQNVVAPRVRLDQEDDEWARAVRGGAAVYFLNGNVTTLGDVNAVDGGAVRMSGGIEVWPQEMFALRGGYNGEVESFTAGVGVRRGSLQFDYAYNDSPFGLMNVFSMTWRFGVPFGVQLARSEETFSPTGQRRGVSLQVQTAVRGTPKGWNLAIRDGGGETVQSFDGEGTPPEWLVWKGDDSYGRNVPNGDYEAVMILTDALGQEWTSVTQVEVLGFTGDTVVPMRIEVSGGE
jgi:hypothetical protein